MLLIQRLLNKIYRHLAFFGKVVPIIQMIEIWTIVRVLTIVIAVITLILQDNLLIR